MRRRLAWYHMLPALTLAALVIGTLLGCAKGDGQAITSLDQLARPGCRIGVAVNCPEEKLLPENYPEAKIVTYTDDRAGYADVASGRIDAFVYARRVMELAIENGTRGVRLLDETYNTNTIAVALSPVTPIPNLLEKLNAFIAQSKEDGTLDDMYDRWVLQADETMPDIAPAKNPSYHLRVATTATVPPYTYYKGTKLNGYDIELARRFAASIGAELEFKIYDFTGVIAAAQSGDVDCIMSNLYYTPEHNEALPFSDPLFEIENTAMVRDAGSSGAASGEDIAQNGAATSTSFSELEHARIGVGTGSVQALQVEERFPEAELHYFSNEVDMLNAMRAGKIDAFASAEALIKYMMTENADLTYLDEWLSEGMFVGAIFPKTEHGTKLCDEFSDFIREIKENGVYEEISDTWFGEDEDKRVVPDLYDLPSPNGTLHMASYTSFVPFAYIKDGKPVGIDIDTVVRFCKQYGYGLEVVPMDFDGIIPSVVTGKVDFGCSGIAYTPERAESVQYSEFTFETHSVIAVLKAADEQAATDQGFWASVKRSFERTFITEERWRLFIAGIGTTLLITVLSIVLGTILGFCVFMLCRNGQPVANAITRFCVWLVQGMPVVVLLMILYYIIFGKLAISGTVVAVVAFTLVFGSAVYAMIKAGVSAIDTGQLEAAYTLGYTNRRAFFRIILPQALPHFMPAYKGEITAIIKATAVVGYIAVQDLTKMVDIIRSRTYEAFFPLIAVAVIYFVLAAILTSIVNRIELRIDPRKRSLEDIRAEVEGQ